MATDNHSPDSEYKSAAALLEVAESAVQRRLVSRRSVIAGAGTLLAGGALTGSAAASQSDNAAASQSNGAASNSDDVSDVDVLNYALTLEHLENAFYRDMTPSDETLMHAETLEPFGDQIRSHAPARIETIGDHESAHVDVLTEVITDLGGDPVSELEYDFGVRDESGINPNTFLAVAMALENTGVAAYNGAIALIDEPKLQTSGATIATVEGRHAAYLNLLNGESPYPMAFDEAKSMEQIEETASQFIVSDD